MKILFVCTGNTCRSPMAEGILNSLAKERGLDVKAESAGLFVLESAGPSEYAIKAAAENGIDISAHKSCQLSQDKAREADLILTMTMTHKMLIEQAFPDFASKVYTLIEYVCESEITDIADPFGGDLNVYKLCFDSMYKYICMLVKKIEDYDKI